MNTHLLVSTFCFSYGLVKAIPSGYLASQALVDLGQSLRQDPKVTLNLLLFLFLQKNLLVQLITFAA